MGLIFCDGRHTGCLSFQISSVEQVWKFGLSVCGKHNQYRLKFDEVRAFASGPNFYKSAPQMSGSVSDISALLQRCKDRARRTKAQRPSEWRLTDDPKASFPTREVADELKNGYLRTFESAYRILHLNLPSFQDEYEQYWTDPNKVEEGFVIVLASVMAIGICFYVRGSTTLRCTEMDYTAQSWLSAPIQKGRSKYCWSTSHCLLLLARQSNFVGPDLVWISVGSLLRTAIHMGLHRDPTTYPKMSPLCTEIRRRLWATILEMAVQISLYGGMPPLISFEDFDTSVPSNVTDDEISEAVRVPPMPKAEHAVTQSLLQIGLFKSSRVRLELVRLINHFRSNPTYEDVLRLSAQILEVIRESAIRLRTFITSTPGAGPTVRTLPLSIPSGSSSSVCD